MENTMEESLTDTLPPPGPVPGASPLQEKDLPYRKLLGSAAESALVVDRQGRIVWVNRKTGDLFGYEPEELLGQSVEILLPERHREAHRRHRAEYVLAPRNRPMGSGLDLLGRRRDGSEFPAEVSLIHAGKGQDLLVMALVRDISELKRSEEARAKLTRERLERLEEEMHILERLAAAPTLAVTARHLGILPLKEYAPDIFAQLVQEYRSLMDRALEARVLKTGHDTSEKLRSMAARLGFLKADPRDVVDLHSAALRGKSRESGAAKVRGFVEEGHLLLVELMGYLASYYRNYAHQARGRGRGNPDA